MYELGVAQELYCESRTRADEMGARELQLVRVAVGELSGVNPELLQFGWKFATSESADENCRLEIVNTAAREVCPQCGAVPQPQVYPIQCERCRCHMRVERGDRVEILHIGFENEVAMR